MNKASKMAAIGSAVMMMLGLAACGDDDAGTEASASFDVEVGSYVLFCTIVAGTAPPRSHFQDGMVNTLTVT